ncbi:hypothetical protein PRUPE_4G281400 [Prunus persica]|uniref:Uncharacterized protein n=1 Tax=Prunus persica TaxID=3760 RepID=A0A251PSA1_PRUPE|nr:hypothetical protein PRUPE_4G281400 [Prunus persica]
MSLHLFHSPLHSEVLSTRYAHQYVLDIGYILDWHLYRKRLPIQHITERWNIAIRNQHWDAFGINCFYHPRTCYFVPTRA